MWDLTSDGYQAFTQPSLGSLCLACKGDQTCNILGRKQKMQTFICQVFPKTAVRGFAYLPPHQPMWKNCSLLQNSPFCTRWYLTRACFSQGWISSSLGNSFAKYTADSIKIVGLEARHYPVPLRPRQPGTWFTNTSLCAGGTPTMFRIWTDINRKMEMAGWWVSWEKPLRVSPRII